MAPMSQGVTDADAGAIEWLLASREPAIRHLARRDLLQEPDSEDVMRGPARARAAGGTAAERRLRRASTRWWKPPPSTRAGEAVDWTVDDSADRIVTQRALAVLRAADGG